MDILNSLLVTDKTNFMRLIFFVLFCVISLFAFLCSNFYNQKILLIIYLFDKLVKNFKSLANVEASQET